MRVDKAQNRAVLHVHLSPADMRELNNCYPVTDKITLWGRQWTVVVHGVNVFEPSKKSFIGRAVDKILSRD